MKTDLAGTLLQGRERTLSRRAERLTDLLESADAAFPDRLLARYHDFAEATPEGHLIQVLSPAGERILPPPNTPETGFPWPPSARLESGAQIETSFEGHPYRIFVRTATLAGGPIRVVVAGQLEDNQNLLRRFTEGLLRAIPVMLIASALAGYFVSRRALNPVARLTDSARSITIGNLSRRLPVSPAGDEIARLASTCNQMLSRLEEAVKSITRFTADASHELRSPITFIRTMSESMLRTPGLNEEVAIAFRDIIAESEQASRLLSDMLTLARFDAGRSEAVLAPLELVELVQDAVGRMECVTASRQQTLSLKVQTEPLTLTADASLLRRLVWILVDNASKYTPNGGRIGVSISRRGAAALLTVTDSGIGIPTADIPHIFERFYRADVSRGEQEGTGLGLAIAKWIADLHSARMAVHSVESSGTTFEVEFDLSGR